jgi:hypothetical protein
LQACGNFANASPKSELIGLQSNPVFSFDTAFLFPKEKL